MTRTQLDQARERIGSLFEGREQEGMPVTAAPPIPPLDALLAKASGKLDEAGEEDRSGDHRSDRDDPGRQDQRRWRGAGGRAAAVAGFAVLSGDVIDGSLSALPRRAEWAADVPPVPGRA